MKTTKKTTRSMFGKLKGIKKFKRDEIDRFD